MSCNGCRVLRKGCSESCVLRPCLQWIETAEAQGHATVFVAKFFGRADLMSFVSNVPENQRPGKFILISFNSFYSFLRPTLYFFPCCLCSSVSVPAVRSLRENGQPCQRCCGPSLDRKLARLPGGRGDRTPRRHAQDHAGAHGPDLSRCSRRRDIGSCMLRHLENPTPEPDLRFHELQIS